MKTEEVLKNLKTNAGLMGNLPLGYTHGIPMLSLRNDTPCLVVPYLKYQITGEVDKTRVFAPRFVATATMKNGSVVKFEDLAYDSRFEEIDFNKPIGLFRHQAIKHLGKNDYKKVRNHLYFMLDKLSSSMTGESEFNEMDLMKLTQLASLLIEPSVKPFYHAINKSFFELYISH